MCRVIVSCEAPFFDAFNNLSWKKLNLIDWLLWNAYSVMRYKNYHLQWYLCSSTFFVVRHKESHRANSMEKKGLIRKKSITTVVKVFFLSKFLNTTFLNQFFCHNIEFSVILSKQKARFYSNECSFENYVLTKWLVRQREKRWREKEINNTMNYQYGNNCFLIHLKTMNWN